MNSDKKNLKTQCFRTDVEHFGLNVTYISFSIYLILYAIFSLTILKITIFPTINRITYTEQVQWGITGFTEYDVLIASIFYTLAVVIIFKKYFSIPLSTFILGFSLLGITNIEFFGEVSSFVLLSSLPIVIIILILGKYILCKSRNEKESQVEQKQNNFKLQNFLKILFLVFVVMESISLVRWLLYPILPEIPSQDLSWGVNFLENNLFYSFGLLSVFFILLSMFCFIIRPLISKSYKRFNKTLENKKNSESSSSHLVQEKPLSDKRISKELVIVFFATIIFSSLISLYPYSLTEIQPTSETGLPGVLGYDFFDYKEMVETLISSSKNLDSFLHTLFVEIDQGSRPLSIFSIYLIHQVSGQSIDNVLTYLPAILGPLLVVSVYFFVLTAYPKDQRLAVISAILTAVSHQIIIGFYGSLFANWMALIVMFVAAGFFIKCFQNTVQLPRNIVLFVFFTLLIMLFHNILWAYFISVMAFFLAWSGIKIKFSKKSIRIVVILGLIIAGIVVVDTIKSELIDSVGGFERNIMLSSKYEGSIEPDKLWTNLDTTFKTYMGGFLTNSAALLLVFLWTLKADYGKVFDRFILSMLFVSLLPFLFGDFVIQSRLIYIFPIQIPASIIMYKIYKNPKITFGKPLFFALILFQFNYALRAMANMNFELPE